MKKSRLAKVITLGLAAVMALGLAGCGNSGGSSDSGDKSNLFI